MDKTPAGQRDRLTFIARLHAARTDERHPYLPATIYDAAGWHPHAWVLDAMAAVEEGCNATPRPASWADGKARDLAAALEQLVECVDEPPEPNCSCHTNPPCGDCVNYSGLRGALQAARDELAEYYKGA